MKGILDWQSPRVVNRFDEATLWSAPFGRLMLENIPMQPKAHVLDIGFGTGFPLVELGQRFGAASKIYGLDIWREGIAVAQEKIELFGLNNIEIFEKNAETIPLESGSLDLICSNLGVNNFDEKNKILKECHRVLKPGGHLSITSNPIGTFLELFAIFSEVIQEMDLPEAQEALTKYIAHRGHPSDIQQEIISFGFKPSKLIADQTNLRFVDALSIFDHSLMRIGFLATWEAMIPKEKHQLFFERVMGKIEQVILDKGEFQMKIPMLYLEFRK